MEKMLITQFYYIYMEAPAHPQVLMTMLSQESGQMSIRSSHGIKEIAVKAILRNKTTRRLPMI